MRRLARDDTDAARTQHPVDLRQRGRQVGQMVQHRVSHHQVEGAVFVRERLGVRLLQVSGEALRLGIELAGVEHALGDITAPGLRHNPRYAEVEDDESGAAADLQRLEAERKGAAKSALELVEHEFGDVLVEADRPLPVIIGARAVMKLYVCFLYIHSGYYSIPPRRAVTRRRSKERNPVCRIEKGKGRHL